jgi:uncharacterized membrane protein
MSAEKQRSVGHMTAGHTPLRAEEAVASRAAIAGHPIHPMLIAFPIAFLLFALVTDMAYTLTDDAFYARMALWMVTAGLITGAVAAIAGLIDFLGLERPRQLRAGQIHAIGNGVVLVLALVSLLGRIGDAEDFIVPWGLALSLLTGTLLAVTGWYGGEMSYRYLIGVDPKPSHGPPTH